MKNDNHAGSYSLFFFWRELENVAEMARDHNLLGLSRQRWYILGLFHGLKVAYPDELYDIEIVPTLTTLGAWQPMEETHVAP